MNHLLTFLHKCVHVSWLVYLYRQFFINLITLCNLDEQRLLYGSLQLCKLFIIVTDNRLTAAMETVSSAQPHTQTEHREQTVLQETLISPWKGNRCRPVCTRIIITIAYTRCILTLY